MRVCVTNRNSPWSHSWSTYLCYIQNMSEPAGLQERKELIGFQDAVMIRPPQTAPMSETKRLASELSAIGFLPIIQPEYDPDNPDSDERFFPTDEIREVGSSIFYTTPYFIRGINERLKPLLGEQRLKEIKKRQVNIPIDGGNYVYLANQKIFVYTVDAWKNEEEDAPKMKTFTKKLNKQGWEIFNLNVGDLEKSAHMQDLDFFLSVFEGKDDKPHAITAQSFTDRLPGIFTPHVISNEEAAKGGCNVADLRQGEILVAPSPIDCPTTNSFLNEFAKAKIISAPEGFLDSGGGPRCAISSFSL